MVDAEIDSVQINNIWEVEGELEGYKSSTDAEDNDTSSEEEEEDGSEEEESEEEEDEFSWYDWNDKEDIFFAMLTGARNSYAAGTEIMNCYGRRTNRFLLLHYGFCMTDNIYDSVRFHARDIPYSEILY